MTNYENISGAEYLLLCDGIGRIPPLWVVGVRMFFFSAGVISTLALVL